MWRSHSLDRSRALDASGDGSQLSPVVSRQGGIFSDKERPEVLRLKQQVLLDLHEQLLEVGAVEGRHGPEDYLRSLGRAVHNWTFR